MDKYPSGEDEYGSSYESSYKNSTAFGEQNKVPGRSSLASGLRNNVSGLGSATFGEGNNVTSDHSFAAGYHNIVNALRTFAFGDSNIVSGSDSFAAGLRNIITKTNSIAAGKENYVDTIESAAFGKGLKSLSGPNTLLGGRYNLDNAKALLQIGNGNSDTDRKNAFEVLVDGTIRIPNFNSNGNIIGMATLKVVNGVLTVIV